jgi:hypothetical protein
MSRNPHKRKFIRSTGDDVDAQQLRAGDAGLRLGFISVSRVRLAWRKALGGFTHMKIFTHVGMRKIVTGWAVFISGSLLLVWLHTFRDSAAHSAILPVLLLLWIVLAVAVWDGCKVIAPPVRIVLLLFQLAAALSASTLFFRHLLRTSL